MGTIFKRSPQYCTRHTLQTRIHLKQPKRERNQRTIRTGQVNSTFQITFDLYKQKKTIDEIAIERKLSKQTIENHLSYFVAEGELNVDEIVNKQDQKIILAAAETFGTMSLKKLKDNLPVEISYGDIRMVLASLQFAKHPEKN